MKVKVNCSIIGRSGSQLEDIIELEDDLSEDELVRQVFDYICDNFLDWNCEIIKDGDSN